MFAFNVEKKTCMLDSCSLFQGSFDQTLDLRAFSGRETFNASDGKEGRVADVGYVPVRGGAFVDTPSNASERFHGIEYQ